MAIIKIMNYLPELTYFYFIQKFTWVYSWYHLCKPNHNDTYIQQEDKSVSKEQ